MTLQYLGLDLESKEDYYILYLFYLVEDGETIFRKADKLVELRYDYSIVIYLINLIQRNIEMIIDFKVDIGDYSEFDIIVDSWQFLLDIEELVNSINHPITEQAIQYIDCYKELISTVVNIENGKTEFPGSIESYKSFIVNSFKEYAYDLYFGNSQNEYSCIEVGDNHSDDLDLFFSSGQPMIFCGDHSKIKNPN